MFNVNHIKLYYLLVEIHSLGGLEYPFGSRIKGHQNGLE